MTAYPTIRVKPGHGRRLKGGSPWAYSNELDPPAEAKDWPLGQTVNLVTSDGHPLGVAGYNRHALIAARLFTRNADQTIDAAFLAGRLRAALALRQRLIAVPHYRLIHAEGDGLPGLIVDRYGDVVVVQANAAAIDAHTPALIDALDQVLAPAAIVLRNDSPARGTEGLAAEVRLATGHLDGPVEVLENGARFVADPLGGQKTGWFFDQRDNRAFAARLAQGRSVADIYSHTGGFAIQAGLASATSVLAVDRSASALDQAAIAARENGIGDRFATRKSDAFDAMQSMNEAGDRFGVVVVDPPAFIKTKKSLQQGLRGYRKMTRLAVPLVEPGGILVACSCSHHASAEAFADQIRRGLVDAGRQGRIVREAGAAPDHPVHPALPETRYLKCLVLALD